MECAVHFVHLAENHRQSERLRGALELSAKAGWRSMRAHWKRSYFQGNTELRCNAVHCQCVCLILLPNILYKTHLSLISIMSAGFTENPFASTHSLDANPFDDPADFSTTASQSNVSHTAKLDDIRQRELDLERREQELANKQENIKRFGRNNWPPCMRYVTARGSVC